MMHKLHDSTMNVMGKSGVHTVHVTPPVPFIMSGCSSNCFAGLGRQFLRSPEMCYATRDEVTGRVWSHLLSPRPSHQRGPALSASNTSQYSGSARGSQPPEGGMFLPCCFAFLAGCRRVTRK